MQMNVTLHVPKTGGSSLRVVFRRCKQFTFPPHTAVPRAPCAPSVTRYLAVYREDVRLWKTRCTATARRTTDSRAVLFESNEATRK